MHRPPAIVAVAVATAAPLAAAETEARAPRTHKVEAPGVVLHVADSGDGTPVLVLSGGPGFAGSHMRVVAGAIDDDHRVILPDQRGTGESAIADLEAGEWSIARSVADLELIREALDIDTWSVVGHSWGAILASAYAAEHPGRLDKLALVGPAGLSSEFWPTYNENIMEALGQDGIAELQKIPPPTEQTLEAFGEFMREVNQAMAPAMLADDTLTDQLAAEMSEDHFEPRVGMLMQGALQSFDLRESVGAFEGEVLVIRGDQDPIGPEVAGEVTGSFRSARLETIEDCGHFPFVEKPETLNRLLAAFLAD